MNIMVKFAERMNEFMVTASLNATDLANKTGIPRSTISGLLREEHLPSTKVLRTFADFFQCPTDYLLGFIDDYPEGQKFRTVCDAFGERLRRLLQETNVSQYSLTKNYKISGNLLYQWLHDQAEPSVYNLIKLSKALNLRIDTLLGRE